MTAIAREAATQINTKQFDILFAANCRYQAAPPIARLTSMPAIFYCQEPYRAFHEAGIGSPLLMNRSRRIREEVKNAQTFDRILVNSEYSRSQIDKVYSVNSEVNYLGIDTDHFKPTGEARGDFILGVGAIQPHKRIELAIESIARLPTPRPLVWIGNMCSKGYRRTLETLANKLGVKLTLLTGVPDADLVSYLSRARLFIYTSRLEPFGLTPLEANACGTPVVAVREGGMCETIKANINGYLCDVTPTELASCMQKLLADPERIERLGISAREHTISEWSWSRSFEQLEKSLHSIHTTATTRNNPSS